MSDAKGINVLAICGSLRTGSYNLAALRTAIELKPPGMTIEIADIGSIPLYNEDIRAQGFPPPVEKLRQQIKEADALLFATPEYNYSIPGALKNAIDWVSRMPNQPFVGKPIAIQSATGGALGGGRMQYDLRRCMIFLDAWTINKPEIFIGNCSQRIDEKTGQIKDQQTIGFIKQQLAAFAQFIVRIGGKSLD